MAKDPYSEYLKNQMGELIDQLNISGLQKQFIKNRWLDQLMWLEKKAGESQRKHFRLRMVTIIGGVIIPAMVSLNIDDGNRFIKNTVFWGTFALAQVVAISAAVEEFFHYGERWAQYRRTAELMKTEGWQYLQLSGPYAKARSHASAYRAFANRVERLIQEDVNAVSEDIVNELKKDREKDEENNATSSVAMLPESFKPAPRPPAPPPAPVPAELPAFSPRAELGVGSVAPIVSEPPMVASAGQLGLDPLAFNDDEGDELPADLQPPGSPILARDDV